MAATTSRTAQAVVSTSSSRATTRRATDITTRQGPTGVVTAVVVVVLLVEGGQPHYVEGQAALLRNWRPLTGLLRRAGSLVTHVMHTSSLPPRPASQGL